jgi:hypothetical protein
MIRKPGVVMLLASVRMTLSGQVTWGGQSQAVTRANSRMGAR